VCLYVVMYERGADMPRMKYGYDWQSNLGLVLETCWSVR
jgi:hypothetical protein